MKTLLKLFSNQQAPSEQLQPWDNQHMMNVVRRLKVSPKDLNDAVIETGSLDLNFIKAYLKKKSVTFSFKRLQFPAATQFNNF